MIAVDRTPDPEDYPDRRELASAWTQRMIVRGSPSTFFVSARVQGGLRRSRNPPSREGSSSPHRR